MHYNVARMSDKELSIAIRMFEEDLELLEEEAEFLNKLLQDTYKEVDRRKESGYTK